MLYPTKWTKPLREEFESDADKLLKIVKLVWRDMDNPVAGELVLDEWQEWLLRRILERYPSDWHDESLAGRLRYRSCVVSIPRQSGKSLLGAILGLYGVAMRTGQTLSLASSEVQARIIYDRVLSTITGNKELMSMFKKTTERRGIVSADGLSRYDIRPAKESALQGLRVDTTLLDELHITKKGMWTAVIQGSTASDSGIVIGLTTAGDANSETLIDLYKQGERAINGDPELERFGFFCWSAPEGSEINEEAVLASNPAVECGRIPLHRIMSDLATIPEHEARRYRLNQFITGSAVSWLPMTVFYSNSGSGLSSLKNAVLSVEVTNRLEHASIVAAKEVDGKYQTEVVASLVNPSENTLYDLITMLTRKHSISAIVLDSSRMPNLQKRLKLNGLPIWQLWAKEVSAACSNAFSFFQQNKVEWNSSDALLIAQMPRGVARYSGENWFISRRDSLGDIDCLMATVMALYVCATHRQSNIGVF